MLGTISRNSFSKAFSTRSVQLVWRYSHLKHSGTSKITFLQHITVIELLGFLKPLVAHQDIQHLGDSPNQQNKHQISRLEIWAVKLHLDFLLKKKNGEIPKAKVDFPTSTARCHPTKDQPCWLKPDATTCLMENILHDLAISDEEMHHLDPYEIFTQNRRKLLASHYNVDGRHPADRYLTQNETK